MVHILISRHVPRGTYLGKTKENFNKMAGKRGDVSETQRNTDMLCQSAIAEAPSWARTTISHHFVLVFTKESSAQALSSVID